MSSEKASTSTLFEALPDEGIEGSAEIEEPSPLQELSELSSLKEKSDKSLIIPCSLCIICIMDNARSRTTNKERPQ